MGMLSAETLEITYNTATDIAGFQFDVEGVTVNGASGGDAQDAGFTVQAANGTVLGFSFSGAVIPAGRRLSIKTFTRPSSLKPLS